MTYKNNDKHWSQPTNKHRNDHGLFLKWYDTIRKKVYKIPVIYVTCIWMQVNWWSNLLFFVFPISKPSNFVIHWHSYFFPNLFVFRIRLVDLECIKHSAWKKKEFCLLYYSNTFCRFIWMQESIQMYHFYQSEIEKR